MKKVKNMLRFVDPNSVKFKDNMEKTFALFEAAERGYIKIMKVILHAQSSFKFPPSCAA